MHPYPQGKNGGQTPGEPSSQRPRRKKRHVRINPRGWLAVAFLALAVFCLIRLIGVFSQNAAVKKQQEENRRLLTQTEAPASASAAPSLPPPAEDAAETLSVSPTPAIAASAIPSATRLPAGYQPEMLAKFQTLYQKNNDLAGWLKVNALYRIDLTVVQGSNDFYMNHDFSKAENVSGSAFLDETCRIWPRDDNLLIYAHNMKSGEMFGELNQLQYADRLYPNPFVSFDTLYEQGTYVPLAVFVCSVVQADDYFQFYVRNFKTEDAFEKYIDRARALSLIPLKTDALYGDELLTLVTCFDRANTQRFVVLLRKLRPNETEESVKAAFFQ